VAQARYSDERGFKLLASLTSHLVSETNATGLFVFVNPEWEKQLGWSPQQMLGHHFGEFLHPDDLTETVAIRDTIDVLPPEGFSNRFRHRQGHYVRLMWRGVALPEARVGVATVVERLATEQSHAYRYRLGARLAQEVQEGAIQLWFQPVVALPSRSLCGFEGLLRRVSNDEVKPAADWLPLVEALGLLSQLTDFVFDSAVEFAIHCPDHFWVGINASQQELVSPDFATRLLGKIEANGLSPGRIALEVSEHVPLQENLSLTESITSCAEGGVSIFMDDFGTSYAALSHLRDYPVSGVKLDKSFVDGVATDRRTRRLARGVADLARRTHMVSIAEGVETRKQEKALIRSGWTHGQGWLYSPAVPPHTALDAIPANARRARR
jgi:PAS domain S-box-containing protein